MKSDTILTMRLVTAKGRKKSPPMLPIIAMGRKTTMFVPALASTATATSEAPIRVASRTLFPSASRDSMLSRTTIELETRTPTESPIASSVEVFIVYPIA